MPVADHPSPSRPIVLVAGRDDWRRDVALNRVLIGRLRQIGLRVEWEDTATDLVHRWLVWAAGFPGLSPRGLAFGARVCQILHACAHPPYWRFLLARAFLPGGPPGSAKRRVKQLRARVRALCGDGPVVILSRSSGGRAASILADAEGVAQVICLGYPFRHPERGEQTERTAHLATMATPMLIVQGRADIYGGPELVRECVLAPAVEVVFLDTDHEFRVGAAEIDWIVAGIEAALAERGLARPEGETVGQ